MTKNSSVGKIYSYPQNPRVFKSQIAAKYLGVEVEVEAVEMGKTNKSAEYLAKFPLGKVPAMETVDGPLYESDAIAYYVANSSPSSTLLGKSNYEKSLVQQWVHVASFEFSSNIGKWYYPIVGYIPYNRANEDKAKEDLKRALGALDTELATKTFLVGERVTLADITLVSALYLGFVKLFDKSFREPYPHVVRWFLTCVNQPHFESVLGKVALCEKAEVYDAKKFKKDEPKKEKKKEEKKSEAEDIEKEIAAEEKANKKNPLDELPPSPLVLDAWKRFYSNNETPQAIEWFWQNYDPQGYSIWKVDYKYNNELTLTFMSSNLIGGFFQRLERARKYAFGSMIVTGENNNNAISGYFVFRGQDVPFEVTDAADYPSYDFKKVNHEDANVKAEFNDYLAWEGQNLPGKFVDGKIFK